MKKRLAIIGAGSSGLITLKQALDRLPDWEIVCFEKGTTTTGCWGDPYPGFVSTSTKYTTQFACYKKWSSRADPADRSEKGDFFRGDEYGRYLNEFAEHFNLRKHIQFGAQVLKIQKVDAGWSLSIEDGSLREECFDKLIICTSLVAKTKNIDTETPLLSNADEPPKNSTILVLGGGESGADVAHRFAAPLLGNRVFLSLKNGVRVSPRYHPIRGVPSDFLRNRLMLSIHRDVRNIIGQKFVEARIRHQKKFEKFFRNRSTAAELPDDVSATRTFWDAKLTAKAKSDLFHVFHTKSDDFLDDVGAGRISIVGPPSDSSYDTCLDFDQNETIEVNPDFICPMIGFTSGLEGLSDGKIAVRDFYEGCVHVAHDDLFLIGFARPIIGNIPTISEMQAKYVTRLIADECERPTEIATLHAAAEKRIKNDFGTLNITAIHPVEMFPYCDRLAREIGSLPTLKGAGSLRAWIKIQLAPASTTHYIDEDYHQQETSDECVHSPALITALLIMIKTVERPLRWLLCSLSKSGNRHSGS